MKYLVEISELYDLQIKPYFGQPKGSDFTEIKALENEMAAKFPLAYTEFLLWMGRDKNGVFSGSNYWIDCVLSNNNYLPELLAENQIDYQLPKSYVTFFMHQGYIAAWFELPFLSENPECLFFSEGQGFSSHQKYSSFTEFILNEMKNHTKHIHKLNKKRKWWNLWQGDKWMP
ncbi:MAG: SMI1/KNR4 family protein [Acidobacteria bacterium]|nr:SMI1/KNR4 family protein [Acidobacteriota bacterium]